MRHDEHVGIGRDFDVPLRRQNADLQGYDQNVRVVIEDSKLQYPKS